ncbi:hypothetical protein L249_6238, partial [Ophiocordyceps polyrhachis-furcata BCC 54312]
MGLPLNYRSSKYVRVLQVGTLKYLEKIISISFSHLLNTNTSPASNSSSIASFRLLRDSSSSSLLQIMPNTKKITFAKLSGGDNYTYWALRMDSLLIREKLQGALGSETYNKSEE